MEVSPVELLKTGERIWNLERIYNMRAGFAQKDDALPERLFEAGSEERGDGIPRQEFEVALQDYYRYRGWDKEGVPSQGKLRELGLGC